MPEAAEVKLITDFLTEKLVGKNIIDMGMSGSKFVKKPIANIFEFITTQPLKCTEAQCKGKFIYLTFKNKYNEIWFMKNSLGMTGFWTADSSLNHNHFFFRLEDNSKIYFNDARKFGNISFTKNESEILVKLYELGHDILGPIYPDMYSDIFKRFKKYLDKNICVALMSQEVLAGVGNYIKAEALFKAEISPWRKVEEIPTRRLQELIKWCRQIAIDAYILKGNSFHTFTNADGTKGSYKDKLKIYKQKIDPYGNEIIKEETPDGRTTYWSPSVQV